MSNLETETLNALEASLDEKDDYRLLFCIDKDFIYSLCLGRSLKRLKNQANTTETQFVIEIVEMGRIALLWLIDNAEKDSCLFIKRKTNEKNTTSCPISGE